MRTASGADVSGQPLLSSEQVPAFRPRMGPGSEQAEAPGCWRRRFLARAQPGPPRVQDMPAAPSLSALSIQGSQSGIKTSSPVAVATSPHPQASV